MNNMSTSCNKKNTTLNDSQRAPKPETIAILRYFARTYCPDNKNTKSMARPTIQ